MCNNNRIIAIDLLKLLAIFFVVWGHCIQHLLQDPTEDNGIFLWIGSFHMPLFMALAGLFAGKSFIRPWKHYLTNRSRQLLIPWFSWSIIILLVVCLFEGTKSAKGIVELFFNSLWFLKSLFICGILALIGFKSSGNRIIWILFSLFISQMFLFWNVYIMYPCFLFGVFCSRKMQIITTKAKFIAITSGIVFALLSFWAANSPCFWARGLGIKKMLISGDLSLTQDIFFFLSIIGKRYGQIILGCLGALFFISLFILLFNKKSHSRISQLALFGQYTLGVYVIQTVIVETVMPRILSVSVEHKAVFNIVIAPSISIVVICISLYINILISDRGGVFTYLSIW